MHGIFIKKKKSRVQNRLYKSKSLQVTDFDNSENNYWKRTGESCEQMMILEKLNVHIKKYKIQSCIMAWK